MVTEDFETIFKRDTAERAQIEKRQADLLGSRCDLANRPAKDVMMSGGRKAVQEGVRVKLAQGDLGTARDDEPGRDRDKGLFLPASYLCRTSSTKPAAWFFPRITSKRSRSRKLGRSGGTMSLSTCRII